MMPEVARNKRRFAAGTVVRAAAIALVLWFPVSAALLEIYASTQGIRMRFPTAPGASLVSLWIRFARPLQLEYPAEWADRLSWVGVGTPAIWPTGQTIFGLLLLSLTLSAVLAVVLVRPARRSREGGNVSDASATGRAHFAFEVLLVMAGILTVLFAHALDDEALFVPLALLAALVLWPTSSTAPDLRPREWRRHWALLVPLGYLTVRALTSPYFICWGCPPLPRAALYVAAGVVATALARPQWLTSQGRPRMRRMSWLVLALFACLLISRLLYRFPVFLLLFIGAYYLGARERAVMPLLRRWVLALGLIPAFGITIWLATRWLPHPTVAPMLLIRMRLGQGAWYFRDANSTAAWLLLLLPLSWAAARATPQVGYRRLLWLVFALSMVAESLTMSRGGWIGCIALGVAAGVAWSRRSGRTWAGVAVAGVALVPLALIAISLGMRDGVTERLDWYRWGWRLFTAHPWVGSGIRGFSAFFFAVGKSKGQIDPNWSTFYCTSCCADQYLESLMSHGILGTALLAGGGIAILKRLKRARRALSPQDQSVVGALLLGLVGTGVSNLFDTIWETQQFLGTFALVTGLIMGAAYRSHVEQSPGQSLAASAAAEAPLATAHTE